MHAIRIFTFISLVCFVAAQIKWSEKAPMPLKRSDFTAHTIGDMIIVAGGCDSDQVCPETDFYCYCPSITNKTHAYSPITNSWKSLPDMPRPRQRHAGAVINQKLFLFGGRDINDNIITEVDVFDVSTNKWTTVFDAYTWGEATSDFTATAIGDKIYAIGGYYQDYRSSNRTAVFDTAELFPQWRYDKAPPLQVGRGDACIGTIGDKIIVVGGFSDENFCKPLESVEIYNPANNSWSFASSIEVPRGDAACVVLNGQFHLIGGEAKDNETNCSKFSVVLHDVEVYNQETNKWSFETNLVVNRFRFAAAAWKNNFYVFGGQSGSKDDAYPVLDVVTAFEDLNEVGTTGTTMMSDASVSVVSAFLLIIVMVIIF